MTAHRPGPLLRAILTAPTRLYDWRLGWLLGHRFMRVTHVGRRSGRIYRTMLEVVGTDPASGEVVVVAGLGARADWYRNITAHPALEVAIGRRRFVVRSRRIRHVGNDQARSVRRVGGAHPVEERV